MDEIIPELEIKLKEKGLELNKNKTKIRNVKDEGFTFLSFDIRQYKSNTLRIGSNRYKRKSQKIVAKPGAKRTPSIKARPKDEECYSCIIKPGKKETKEFLNQIREYLKNNARTMSFDKVIKILNSKIRGWLNYYRFVGSKETFSKVRKEGLDTIYRYLRRKHSNKTWKWIKRKYYKVVDEDKLNPYAIVKGKRKKEEILINAAKDVPIIRYEKVKGTNSPLDPELTEYWKKRQTKWGKTNFAKGSKYERIYTEQKGICPVCGVIISREDLFEVHHINPIKNGGNNSAKNMIMLHKHCHKAKHKMLHYQRSE